MALVAGAAACTAVAQAGGLYRCTDARGATAYSPQPCVGSDSRELAVDRVTSEQQAPAARAGEGLGQKRASAPPAPHRLTAEERQRIQRLRRAEAELPAEAGKAAEIEIAAIREGADARLSPQDRALLDGLREPLRAGDRERRVAALQAWRRLYAMYRAPSHPRLQPVPPALGREGAPAPAFPEPPLGALAPGTHGPLVASPPGVASAPSGRPGPVADPATGQVLVPWGDRLVDPITGTLWMRAGRSYVDPATGRMIPAP